MTPKRARKGESSEESLTRAELKNAEVSHLRPLVMPRTFEGGDWDEFLIHFNAICVINRWLSEDIKAQHLVVALRGSLLTYYSKLPAEVRTNFTRLTEHLRDFLNPPERRQLKRMEFRRRVQGANESFQEFAQALEKIVSEAYPGLGQELAQDLLCDQFVFGLRDREVRMFVRRSFPRTSPQAISCALEQQAVLDAEKCRGAAVAECWAETEDGVQTVAAVPRSRIEEEEVTELRREVARLSEAVRELAGKVNKPSARPGPVCWQCGQAGHVKSRCGQATQKLPTSGKRERVGVSGLRPTHIPTVGHIGGYRRAVIEVEVDGLRLPALIDTGASLSIISSRTWGNRAVHKANDGCLKNVSGDPIRVTGKVTTLLRMGGFEGPQEFVIADISHECILGDDFLSLTKAILSFREGTLNVAGKVVEFRSEEAEKAEKELPPDSWVRVVETRTIPPLTEQLIEGRISCSDGATGLEGVFEPCGGGSGVYVARTLLALKSSSVPIRVINTSDHQAVLPAGMKLGRLEWGELETQEVTGHCQALDLRVNACHVLDLREVLRLDETELTEGEKQQLHNLVEEFRDIWSHGNDDLGRTGLAKHRIETGGHAAIKQRPRPLPFNRRQEVQRMVDDMLARDIVEPSISPWTSPVVLVKKKDGSLRFCVDYRRLNDVTVKDAYPLPRIHDILDSLHGSRYFSTLDMASGYWQVEVDEKHREKTAFSTGQGLYQFKVMPFGLCNAPGTFQRLMDVLLAGLHWKTSLVYIDDVIIWSCTFSEHVQRLREVFTRLRGASIKLKPSKCYLGQTKIRFLGHIVSEKGVSTDPEKTKAVKEWPEPRNKEELRSFLGFASYYRRFVKDFASIAAPLNKLLSKGMEFLFHEEARKAFEALKVKLISAPILGFPIPEGPFTLDTDASDSGIGAVLNQTQQGVERVIAYSSRALSKPEKRYCVTRKEMLALVEGVRHFRHYLYGKQFKVRTDHRALKWLKSLREPEGQVARWLEYLAEFDFQVIHRPGRLHGNADGLSRSCRQCERELTAQKVGDHPIVCETDWLPQEDVGGQQDQDADLKLMKEWVEARVKPPFQEISGRGSTLLSLWSQWDRLRVDHNVLYRQWLDGDLERLQVVIPRERRKTVFDELHAGRGGAHLGLAKTVEKLRARFYWPGLQSDCEVWVRGCTRCYSRKGPVPRPRAPLQMSVSGFPFQRVAMDILGPLPVSSRGNKYILVVSDYFTKWTEAYSLVDIQAMTVARVFAEEFVCRYGAPTEVHTDQGRQFEAELFSHLCGMLGITKTRTTPYHPQSDGQVERFNRTLCDLLSMCVNDRHTDWDEHLPYVMLAYRASVHASTGFTPHFALLGREVRLPVDVVYGRPERGDALAPAVEEMRGRLERAHALARQHLQASQRHQKDHYDRKATHGERSFAVGDRVWVWTPLVRRGRSSKFLRGWSGPYEVVKVLSDVTYRVRDCSNPRRRSVIHFNRMRPSAGRAPPQGRG